MPRYRIRARVIVPIGVGLLIVIAAHVIGVNVVQRAQLQERVEREVSSIKEELLHQQESEAHLLMATSSALAINRQIQQTFIDRDRQKLFEVTKPLFDELKSEHQITHLYFTDLNRINFYVSTALNCIVTA